LAASPARGGAPPRDRSRSGSATRLVGCGMAHLHEGDAMPETTLVGETGPMQLRDRIGKPLVVYFYPKDDTFGCTKEACSFRDHYEDFLGAGAEVFGVSRDNAESHAKFNTQHRLPFTLLTDPDG